MRKKDLLRDAVIAVMNGMTLMDSFNVYGSRIKTDGKAEMAAYGKIRNAVLKFCKDRNPNFFEELRQNDAVRNHKAKKGSEKEAHDVAYETLQLQRHRFLEDSEVSAFESHIELSAGLSIADLLKEKMAIEERLARTAKVIKALGVVKTSNRDLISTLLKYADKVDAKLDENIKKDKDLLVLAKTADRKTRIDHAVEFEKSRSSLVPPLRT